MAGIGFELRRLRDQNGLSGKAVSIGHGTAIAAGPWLATVLSMAAIQLLTPELDRAQAYAFRGLVVYSFMLSLVATAPIVYVATRQVADDVFTGRFEAVASRFAAAILACAGACIVVSIVVLGGLLGMSGTSLAVGIALTGLTGIVWPTLAFCGAVRDFEAITAGFALGLVAAVAGTVVAVQAGLPAPAQVAAYGIGIAVVAARLVATVLATFPHSVATWRRPLAALARDARRFRLLALAGLVGTAALWADKWTVWASDEGARLENGIFYAPAYDSAMFVAYLAIVPALALFIIAVETTLLDRLRAFLASIREHGSLDEIDRRALALEVDVRASLVRILAMQTCLCAVAAILAPALVGFVGLHFSQVGILRLGLIAGLFQFLFFACGTILVFVERHGAFLALQVLFLVLQISLTRLTLVGDADYLGFGHLAACALSALAAVWVLDRSLARLTFLTFDAALSRGGGR